MLGPVSDRARRTLAGSYDFSALVTPDNQRQVVFVAELWREDERVAWSVVPFVPNRHLRLREPGLTVKTRVEKQTFLVEVTAQALARFVELAIDGTVVVFSDNYFDLPAGASVAVTCPLPERWTGDSQVQARSLFDSFA